MSGFWDNNGEISSEWESLEDTLDDAAQQVLEEIEEPEQIEEKKYMTNYEPRKKQVAYSLDNRESNIVTDAMIRLEQARLYDLLIKHDMFKGIQAHPQALANVQNELKTYIVQRLEILLGIKQEQKNVATQDLVVESPFNKVETMFLKMLAKKGTGGESENAETVYLESIPVESEAEEDIDDNSVDNYKNMKLSGNNTDYLAPLQSEPVQKQPVKKTAPKKKQPVKKAVSKKKQPVKKAVPKKVKNTTAKTNRRGLISNTEAERLAREDMERMANRKPVEKMTAQELLEANKKINTTTNKVRPANALPIPTEAQLNMHYQAQQLNRTSQPNSNAFNALLSKVLADKK